MMIRSHLDRYKLARCSATTNITVTEQEALVALPDPVDPIRLDLACELAIGHDDRHVGFDVAAHGGHQAWWLRWIGRRRDAVQVDMCDGKDLDEQDDCLLPEGHRGPHSF